MATLNDYKGLEVVEDATGDGGIALTDNFKELADRAPYQAAANPGVNDDSTKGFSPGDQWLNTSTQVLWACVSHSSGAAVWKSVLKRTSTELQLIPGESNEKVQTQGVLDINGTGNSRFAGNVHLHGVSDPTLRLAEGGSSTSYSEIIDPQASQLIIKKVSASGQDLIDIFPIPENGTSEASVRMFHNTNTSGNVRLEVLRGNNTYSTNCRLGGNVSSFVNALVGNFGIGTDNPSVKCHLSAGSNTPGNVQTPLLKLQNAYPSGGSSGDYQDTAIDFGVGSATHVRLAGGGSFSNNNPGHFSVLLSDYSNVLQNRLHLTSVGNVGVGTTTPTALCDINGNTLRLRTSRTPASASAAGNQGDLCWDANYVYVCVGTNTWKRAALTTW